MFKVGEKSESMAADRGRSRDKIQIREASLSKQSIIVQRTLFCGIDVSAVSLAVAVQQENQFIEERDFPNNAGGHRLLIAWLRRRNAIVRVTLEATGIYSLDLSVALAATDGIELAVLNPKVANRFAQTLRRSKTDAADAQVLAEYRRRMPFTAWCAPNQNELQIRTICRHVESLTATYTRSEQTLCCSRIDLYTPLRGSRPEARFSCRRAAHPQTAPRSYGVGPKQRQHSAEIRPIWSDPVNGRELWGCFCRCRCFSRTGRAAVGSGLSDD
jgi:hypothetical protein